MKRARTGPAAPRTAYVKLQCPECTHIVRVARDELVEGAAVHCRYCGEESELTLGFDGGTGKEGWMLLDPLADFQDDAEARR